MGCLPPCAGLRKHQAATSQLVMPYIKIAFSLKWRAVSLLASKILSVAWLCGSVDTTPSFTPHAKIKRLGIPSYAPSGTPC